MILREEALGLTAALKIGGIRIRSRDIRRGVMAVATGGLSELGGLRTASDLATRELITKPAHQAQDAANAANADAARATSEAQAAQTQIDQTAMEAAREAVRRARLRRGQASTILTSPLGLPGGGTGVRTLLGG